MSIFFRSQRLFRLADWWQFKVAHLLGFAYYVIFLGDLGLGASSIMLGFYLVGVFGISVTGHIINDYYDLSIDLKAGKPNSLSNYKQIHILIIVLVVQLFALLPWIFLYANAISWILILLQYLLYILYSHPRFRWKEKGLYGVLADSLYGHAIPLMVTVLVLSHFTRTLLHLDTLFLVTLFLWQVFKGVRNIILHQIEDRKMDGYLGVQTYVVRKGGMYALNLVNRLIIPIEIVLIVIITWMISLQLENFYIGLLLFALWIFLKFSGWLLFTIPYRQLKFKFLFFLNDFYEDWMPFIFLIFLIRKDIAFVIFLILHLILFRKALLKFLNDIVLIFNNIFPPKKYANVE